MELFTIVGILGFIFRFGYKLSGLIYLWWRKEYRFDRMAVHLRTKQGISIWGGKTHATLAALLVLWFKFPQTIYLLSFFIFGIGISYARKFRTWKLPPPSPKVMAILVTTLFLIITFVQTAKLQILITLTISDLLLFPVTSLLVLLVTFPTILFHRWMIAKAVHKLASHKPMKVIGVTGSYGKTSVKEYVATILSSKFKTLSTEASKNSPIGIAEVVLRSLNPSHEAFVVEMGAYKRGEIQTMCKMVRPEIGILTAINAQHQDLFGSIENTIRAKYELVEGLVDKKLLIANADNPNVRKMGEQAKIDGCTVIWYSTKNAKHIVARLTGTEFDCVFEGEQAHIKTTVIGEHQVSNILAAISAAIACGMSLQEAAAAASKIRPTAGVMNVIEGVNGSVFIDDTFNNNPDAAKAAIAFLGSTKGKKFLVLQPMIELGAYADSAHEEVGEAAGKAADAIFLTNSNWYTPFEHGVRRVSKTVPLTVSSPENAAGYIRSHVKKGDMVLFKGKDAKHALDQLV